MYWYDFYDHPRLQWSHSSNSGDYVTNYQIYRNQGEGWELISTQSAALLYFVDYEIDIEGPPEPTYLYYKIRSKNGSRTSDEFSNIVKVAGPDDFGKNSNNDNLVDNKFQYILKQNYPNPFNPSTSIDYSIKSIGLVRLKIYDMLGKEVATLVNEIKDPGNYTTLFNASDLPSGIYVYELTSGNFVATKKLILLK